MKLMSVVGLLLLVGTFSCNSLTVSESEEQAIEEILDYYGGVCHRVKGFDSENGKTRNYFELKMESEVVDEQMLTHGLPPSNIAYLFYTNLGEDKNKYDDIHVRIGESEDKYIFPTSQLARVESRMQTVNILVGKLKSKDYEAAVSMLNIELIPIDKQELKSNLTVLEPQFGNISEFVPLGFKIVDYKGVQVLHISGYLLRDIKSTELSVDLDYDSDAEEALQFAYKL